MKKVIAALLCILMMFSAVLPCGAAESKREYLADGSYIVVGYEYPTIDFPGDGSGNGDNISGEGEATPESSESNMTRFLKNILELLKKIITFLKNQKTVTETKYVSYYGSDGVLIWIATVTADFTYNGKSSVCDSVKTGYAIYDSDWSVLSRDCSKSANNATAYFKFRQNKLGVPLKVIEKTVTMFCDKDGNIK